MDSRTTPFFFSFPIGTWLQTQVSVSLLFLLMAPWLMLVLGGPVGAQVFLILFTSVLAHEFGHVLAARATGGDGDSILLWPLGGLVSVRPAPELSSRLITYSAGLLVNLVLMLIGLGALLAWKEPIAGNLFALFSMPTLSEGDTLLNLSRLLVSLNFKLLCINLIPALPLDGGLIVNSFAEEQGGSESRIQVLRLGMFVSIGLVLVGMIWDDTFPVVLAFFVAVVNLQSYFELMYSGMWREGSLLFPSGETFGEVQTAESSREEKRRQKLEAERIETVRKVDELLDKVHREGMGSLTDAEKRFLKDASQRYRNQES